MEYAIHVKRFDFHNVGFQEFLEFVVSNLVDVICHITLEDTIQMYLQI